MYKSLNKLLLQDKLLIKSLLMYLSCKFGLCEVLKSMNFYCEWSFVIFCIAISLTKTSMCILRHFYDVKKLPSKRTQTLDKKNIRKLLKRREELTHILLKLFSLGLNISTQQIYSSAYAWCLFLMSRWHRMFVFVFLTVLVLAVSCA